MIGGPKREMPWNFLLGEKGRGLAVRGKDGKVAKEGTFGIGKRMQGDRRQRLF